MKYIFLAIAVLFLATPQAEARRIAIRQSSQSIRIVQPSQSIRIVQPQRFFQGRSQSIHIVPNQSQSIILVP